MQCDPSRVDNDNQHPPVNPPPYGSENVYQLYPAPPPYGQYPQQSIRDIRCTTTSAQHYDQTSLNEQQDALVVPHRDLLTPTQDLTIITSKLRAFFIISGIGYLLLGGGKIGLELCIIMYSSSTYYRSIWIGGILLGAGINMLVVAYRVSHPMIYTIQLLISIFLTITIGVSLSILELIIIQPCENPIHHLFCDTETGKTLKVITVGELNIAAFYTSANLSLVWRIRTKSASTPPTTNASSSQC